MDSEKDKPAINDLPVSRKSQFWFLLRQRWKSLLVMGGVVLLFAIPLLASLLVKDLKAISIVSASTEGEEVTALFLNDLFYGIFVVPSSAILFLGLAGIYRIIRNYIWGEGVLFGADFFLGIKQNWKLFLVDGLLFSLLYYGVYLATVYISVPFLKYLPLAIAAVLLYPILLIHLNLSVIYKNGYFKQLMNASVIYFRKAYVYLGFFLALALVPVILLLVPLPLLVKYIIIFAFIYLFIPFYILAFSLYSMHVFDALINKENHKELYKKGLF